MFCDGYFTPGRTVENTVYMYICIYRQVYVRFTDSIRKPGEPTRLIITATPGSRVAVTAIDKSVHVLKGGNELTQDDVSFWC